MLFFPIWFSLPPGAQLPGFWGQKRKKDKTMTEDTNGSPTLVRVSNPSLAGRNANLPGLARSVKFDARGISEPIPETIAETLYEAGYRVVSLEDGNLPERDLGVAAASDDSPPAMSIEETLQAERTVHAANIANAVKERDEHWNRAIGIETARNETLAAQLARYQGMTPYIERAEMDTPDGGKVRLILVEDYRDLRDDDGLLTAVKVVSADTQIAPNVETREEPLITDLSEAPEPVVSTSPPGTDEVITLENRVKELERNVGDEVKPTEEPADAEAASEEAQLADALNSLPLVGGAPSIPDSTELEAPAVETQGQQEEAPPPPPARRRNRPASEG